VKRGRKLDYRNWRYKRHRRDILDRLEKRLSVRIKQKRRHVNPANRAVTLKLYKNRARVLRAARRKARLNRSRYRRHASYFNRIRLYHIRRALKRQRSMRRIRKNRTTVKYKQQVRRTLRFVVSFLRPRTRRPLPKTLSSWRMRVTRAITGRSLATKTSLRRVFIKKFAITRRPTQFTMWRRARIAGWSLLHRYGRKHRRRKAIRNRRILRQRRARGSRLTRKKARRRIKKVVA
jgi:hypothetical protein